MHTRPSVVFTPYLHPFFKAQIHHPLPLPIPLYPLPPIHPIIITLQLTQLLNNHKHIKQCLPIHGARLPQNTRQNQLKTLPNCPNLLLSLHLADSTHHTFELATRGRRAADQRPAALAAWAGLTSVCGRDGPFELTRLLAAVCVLRRI